MNANGGDRSAASLLKDYLPVLRARMEAAEKELESLEAAERVGEDDSEDMKVEDAMERECMIFENETEALKRSAPDGKSFFSFIFGLSLIRVQVFDTINALVIEFSPQDLIHKPQRLGLRQASVA